jgi:hypothetical protein
MAKQEEVKKTYTQEEFQKMYLQLCALTGWQHGSNPIFKNMGEVGYLINVQFTIVPYTKEEQNANKS